MLLHDIVKGFREVATASVADAVDKLAGKRGYMDHPIKPRINDKRVVGPAVTVLEGPTTEFLPPQHALDLIDSAAPGSVMVIGISGEADVAVWGGLRGALALALALSLNSSFPYREQILELTFSVVAFSILAQGLTLKPLLRILRLADA